MRRRMVVVLAWGALLLATPDAFGATAVFNFGSSCTANCGAVGVGIGDLVIGRMEISTDGFAPSGAVGRDDLVNFAILFGETSNGVFKAESPGYDFAATWGVDTTAITGVSFTAAGSGALGATGPFVSTSTTANVISLFGTCRDVNCMNTAIEGGSATIAPARYTPRNVAPVPLPPAALLLGAGLAALAAAARRRKPGRSG